MNGKTKCGGSLGHPSTLEMNQRKKRPFLHSKKNDVDSEHTAFTAVPCSQNLLIKNTYKTEEEKPKQVNIDLLPAMIIAFYYLLYYRT